MINIETKFSGDLAKSIDEFAKAIQDKVVISGVAAAARVIYDEVKSNAGRRTHSGNRREHDRAPGTLEGAIYRVYAKERSTGGLQIYKVSVNKSKAPHWHLIEFGWSRAPAYPYIRPAADHLDKAIKAGLARMTTRLDEISIEGKE